MASLKKSKKYLSFEALRKEFSTHLETLDDKRQTKKCDYSLHDTVMSAFACMYFQEPSLLQFQQRLENKHQRNNLQTIFRVKDTPKDSQLRELIDTLPGESFAPLFKDYYERLRRHKYLEEYAIFAGTLMCVIDGTQYHSSKSISCDSCLHRTHRNGSTTYSHGVLQGAIMHPDKRQVLPVMPEAIKNGDGSKKQDCETAAAKRFIKNLRAAHPRQQFILGGDGLMSHQPLIETALEHNMHVLFVAKPGDHTYLFEWLNDYPTLPTKEYTDDKGCIHRFRWQNKVPLNGSANAIEVNYVEYQQINQGKVTFKNSWVTDITITGENIISLARAGRCRWKIENECFNTLKNQGYNIEHNYGHGNNNLSYNMYLLTLLAFFYHQIFELTDGVYQECRRTNGSKKNLWDGFRFAIQKVVLESWEMLMDWTLNEDDYEVLTVKKK